MDYQIDQQTTSSTKHHTSSRVYKSPCSSHSVCSSSGSGSGSESYTGSSSGSCSSSSCSSSSFSEDEERTTSHKNYKKNVSTISMQPTNTQRKSYVAVDKTRVHSQHHHTIVTPPPQQRNKRYSNQINTSSSSKRLRSRSPQSTTSSYYSRKSRVGPLTPPLPSSSHHSLSNLSTNTPTSIKAGSDHTSAVKLDRHGNVRVSLKDKERQRRTTHYSQTADKQQLNSSPSFSSQQNLSINNYSKSSRSPLDRSRDDLYSSSFGSVDDRKKFTPSPVNYHPQQRNKQNYSTYDNSRSPSSFYYNNSSKQSTSSLRQNLSTSSSQYHRSPSYLSPSVDHHGHVSMLSPRTPPLPSHMLNKPKMYNYHNNNNNNSFEEKNAPHPLDPLVISRPPHQPQMKRNFNKFNSNNSSNSNNFIPQHQPTNYSPLRTTKGPIINTHHPHPYSSQQEHNNRKQPQNFMTFNQNKPPLQQQPPQQQLNNKNLKLTKQPFKPLPQQQQQQQQSIVKQSIVKPQQSNAPSNKPVDQVVADEISSISNNSLEDIDESNLKEQPPKVDKKEEKIEKVEKNEKDDAKQNCKKEESKDEDKTEVSKNEPSNKNEEGGDAFSDENFSEWSDVEDYYGGNQAATNDNKTQQEEIKIKTQPQADNYDDLKSKIEEELEEISDGEFDAIIDEQDNEKSGMLSCKQVLDQLDINWASLIRDKECNDEDKKKQSINTSARSRFKSTQLLSQIGISSKYCGPELRNLIIRNYCSAQLNDEHFDFESPLAVLHNLKIRTKQLCKPDDLFAGNTDPHNIEVLSNGNLNNKKILSFNHLVLSLRKKQEEDRSSDGLKDAKSEKIINQDVEMTVEQQDSKTIDEAISV